MIEVEAGIQRRDANQAPQKQRRHDEKHDGCGDLADDKRMPEPEATCDTTTTGALHVGNDADVARPQGGNNPAQ